MTFSQLRALVTVSRYGSVKAAALKLQVSQAAVSQAIGGLRREFGDELYLRAGRGISLTPRGRQLANMAVEILGLAEQGRRLGDDVQGERLLRIAATGTVTEYALSALIEAFARRMPGLSIQLTVGPAATLPELLRLREADVTIGPDPAGALGLACVPFLRYELIVINGPQRRVVGADLPGLAREQWLQGPYDADASSEVGRVLAAARVTPDHVRVFPSHAAALSAVVSGHGLTVAVAHTVAEELERKVVVRMNVAGTPTSGLWYASALAGTQAPPAARALLRFVTTPEATRATLSGGGGVPPGRLHPPIHITLWSGIGGKQA